MMKEPLAVAKRWFPDPADAKVTAARHQHSNPGTWAPLPAARGNSASRRTRLKRRRQARCPAHPRGLAVRLAACRYGCLTEPQIAARRGARSKFVFGEVVRNEWLWSRAATGKSSRLWRGSSQTRNRTWMLRTCTGTWRPSSGRSGRLGV